MNKINFIDGQLPDLCASTLNTLQENMEEIGAQIGTSEPTTSEKVWLKKGKNMIARILYSTRFDVVKNIYSKEDWTSCTDPIEIELNKSYVFSHELGTGNGGIVILDKNYQFLENINQENIIQAFTVTNPNAKYAIVHAWKNGGITPQNESWMQLEQGTVATAYEEYIEPTIYVKNSNGVFERFVRKNIEFEIVYEGTQHLITNGETSITCKPVNGLMLGYFIQRAWPSTTWSGAVVSLAGVDLHNQTINLATQTEQDYSMIICALYIPNN